MCVCLGRCPVGGGEVTAACKYRSLETAVRARQREDEGERSAVGDGDMDRQVPVSQLWA